MERVSNEHSKVERVLQNSQPVGAPLPDWAPRRLPDAERLQGRWCTLERLDADRHADELSAAYAASEDSDWTYLPVGPFESADSYRSWVQAQAQTGDPRHYAVIDAASGRAVGTLSLMRHDPANGVIEVGWVVFSRAMQRTPISTEAHFLLMGYVFDELGYRRYEWKCDSLNAPSRRAAERLGFEFEGTFRQSTVYKGRSRDTSWFSIIDREWPQRRRAFEAWLAPENFDDDGKQRTALRGR
ncbi:GNAT family protein [Pseudoclavibacter terrae]|uniref:GNAT family N-acetyltransferase n=1 Tax=Pseudoclavibacter terrae TaxID=1530195 RepID=A0A7J5AZW5_9MICO|nr:GNAT family N-acetyltransferase [Pseudoclavibacter terrae]